jgi:putative molybdopterin biosynthesis protein
MPGTSGLTAYPMGKGSGSVTTFSRADGFVVISRHQEYIEANEKVEVVPIGRELIPADLVVIGSHCIGLDSILSQLSKQNKVRSKTLWVGSQGGLDSVSRGECDIAGTHLLDPITDQYNTPFLNPDITLIHGYGRMQGFVFRSGDPRFINCSLKKAIEIALSASDCRMVCRNRGSGTRVLIDQLLDGLKPTGYNVEVRSHHAVAASVIQARSDWGITIEPVARQYGLEFIPIRQEFYDFAVKQSNRNSSTVHQFIEILKSELIQSQLIKMGFMIRPETGSWL